MSCPVLTFEHLSISVKPTTFITFQNAFDRAPLFQIECGPISVSKDERHGTYQVDCRLIGATDFEHDSLILFGFSVVGLELEMITRGYAHYRAWLGGDDAHSFKVPPIGYNPLLGSVACREKECKAKSHLVVKEGNWVPKPNVELYNMLRGMQVEIRTAP